MQYYRELKAFYKQMERAPLSTTAQLLWYKLMEFDNGLFWREDFQVDNDRLMRLVNVSSRNTLASARKELVDAGLLTFSPGKKGAPSTYHLRPASLKDEPERPSGDGWSDDFFLYEDKEDITTYFGYTEALGRELKRTTDILWKEFLPGETPTEADERDVFFIIMDQEHTEEGDTVMSFPEERKRMLSHAFEIARTAKKVNWRYIKGIFGNWAKDGLRTMEAIYEHEDERDRRRGVS